MTTGWVVQRIVDGFFYNGFKTSSWSKHVSAAVAFASKDEATSELEDRGWRVGAVIFLLLPKTRRSPLEFARLRLS